MPQTDTALTLVETSPPERRDITEIVADFRAVEEALNTDLARIEKYERQIDNIKGKIETAHERAKAHRLEMARVVWEARQWWEAARAADPQFAGWGQFAEEQFGKSRAEINRLWKTGRADDPAEQLRAERERDRERKRAVSETPNSETSHSGDIADASETPARETATNEADEASHEQTADNERSRTLYDIANMLELSPDLEGDIRDIVECFVDARIDEISEPVRQNLVRYFAEVMKVAIPLGSAPQEVANAAE